MATPLLNLDEVWAAIDAQRLRTAAMLDDLTEDEWEQPSLCAGWRVRDVTAHLTLQQLSLGDVLGSIVRSPGNLNHVIHASAVRAGRQPTATFAPQIRNTIGSRRHNFGVTPLETLIDALVHPQDIAIPLGREMRMDARAAATAAARVWSYGGKGSAKVFRALSVQRMRLVANDIDWSVAPDSGETVREIRGPIAALLLLLTGRTTGLDQLEGSGVEQLRERA
ncbi:maleylpyruvate isomerase family mycothiol-dependent enzyme [Gulosibacter sp. ACHW.36C]|uniref:Maleylpyruvate isomerase family mycothiol-dependent enzyme n=1 Tax=Gulosibacter sediminis TaxID=1729695 RepID=A0ABY4MXS0_9MICO|nr:maleylpyruvate isomerase family mycothiol-dependent enzyme [Gulosibacter sediminis]UQN14579.1 maleylpyruvate isomerase family mycothiol-dependent enzyme [Gulosibacter sediminis]